jgi:hypothetical protein
MRNVELAGGLFDSITLLYREPGPVNPQWVGPSADVACNKTT